MVHSLNQNGVLRMREHRKESIGANSEFAVVRPDQSHEEVLRIRSCLFKACHNSSRDRALQPQYVTDGSVGPTDGPRRQRPNRFLTCSWSVSCRDRMSRRALRSPIRNASA